MDAAVIVVCSFPRSGTHFLIDVLRRNFEALRYQPPVWASAETLYFNLDREAVGGAPWSTASLSRPFTLVKTHRLFFDAGLEARLAELAGGRPVKVLTPYRRLTRILESYHRYTGADRPIEQLLDSTDPFFQDGASVEETVSRFYSAAAERSVLVDVEALKRAPEAWLQALSAELGLARRPNPAPLPPRRTSHGFGGELAARLTGRQSSEVVVPAGQARAPAQVSATQEMTQRMQALQSRLDSRALRPVGDVCEGARP
ncbi:MAG: hypothetical protein AAF253_01615 [Pseudomonadota bacterium]